MLKTSSITYHYRFHLLLLIIAAFTVRAVTFYGYLQHHERYQQPDSRDYFTCGFMIAHGFGMHLNYQTPVFLRTPGYPLYLAPFYYYGSNDSVQFSDNAPAHKKALWIQLTLCSLTPVLIFVLTLMLTSSVVLAWIAGILFAVHLAFVLASCYLLTEALSLLFFMLFLIFFYRNLILWKEKDRDFIVAALWLALYTWMRPNGIFIAIFSAFLLVITQTPWQKKLIHITVFLCTFFTLLSPWYIRNYQLTGNIFFCSFSGPYLQAFCAPKILRRLTGQPLGECSKSLMMKTHFQIEWQKSIAALTRPGKFVCEELVCGDVCWPLLQKYPHYLVADWTKEMLKTTFDLYGSQLVAFLNNTHTFDLPEEFLGEKIALCLYKQPMSSFMRFIIFVECLYMLLLWIGIFGGIISFFLISWLRNNNHAFIHRMRFLWLKVGLMIACLLFMTGGFGYARLRLPVEPLLVILSLTWWYFSFQQQKDLKQ